MSSYRKEQKRSEFNSEELLQLLADEESCAELEGEDLTRVVEAGIRMYGETENKALGPLLARLYVNWVNNVPVDVRRAMYIPIRTDVVALQMSPVALMPFMVVDSDIEVVAAAARDFACVLPLQRGDKLSGPKAVLNLFRRSESAANRAGMFAGLLALGDQRVIRLLWQARWELGCEELRLVSLWSSGCLHDATLRFLLSWLQELPGDPGDWRFGMLTRAVATQIEDARVDQEVLAVSLDFPLTQSATPIRVERRWPLKAYLRRVRTRLRRIEAREPEPKVVPNALELIEAKLADEGRCSIAPPLVSVAASRSPADYWSLMGRKDWPGALALLDELRTGDPADPALFINSAFCLHAMGRTGEAKAMLLTGPAGLDERPLFHYNLACYEAQLGNLDEAGRRLQRALELSPGLAVTAAKDPDLAPLRLGVN